MLEYGILLKFIKNNKHDNVLTKQNSLCVKYTRLTHVRIKAIRKNMIMN